MLKIPKGLKKKKKGKKGKHKEEELFDPAELAELERYKKEKQQKLAEAAETAEAGPSETSEPAPPGGNEEWEKFKALTSGVDDILKKTQGDLDRIKSTSYYQKKPPGPSVPVEPEKKPEPSKAAPKPPQGRWVGFEEGASEEPEEEGGVDVRLEVSGVDNTVDPFEAEKVEEEEEESEFEDDADDLFDTSYVDALASGEVKLAYVPDSPELEETDFDPFDTSIVDKVIKVDPLEEKKRKLVSLGCAVEVLTGKLEKPVEVPPEIVNPQRRRPPRPRDLLLGSFDEGPVVEVEDTDPEPFPKSILDDDPVFAEKTSEILGFAPVTPIAEVKPVCSPLPRPKVNSPPKNQGIDLKTLVEEFVPSFGTTDVCDTLIAPALTQKDEDSDDEFAALAAESLHKAVDKVKPPKPPRPQLSPNQNTGIVVSDAEDDFNPEEDDPFDTTFAAQVLPGKFEIKLIEKEILTEHIAVVNTDHESKIKEVLKNSELSAKVVAPFEESVLKAEHKDLLGGSASDLTQLAQSPIAPKSLEDFDSSFTHDDPFDTSVVDQIVVPGKTELKFLEKELLTTSTPAVQFDDEDFDPRAEEKSDKPPPRPDNLLVPGKKVSIPKVVAFDVQSPNHQDLLAVDQEENSKVSKPLTPYYPQPAQPGESEESHSKADPFDTSYVSEISKPGKLEIQLLEKELASTHVDLKRSLSDPDFDPRGIEQSSTGQFPPQTVKLNPDILSGDVDEEVKLHTPVIPQKAINDLSSEDIDPFDTSIASGLIPGKAEIKILETELIYSKTPALTKPALSITEELLKNSQASSARKLSVADVLEQDPDEITVKPLTPVTAGSDSFEIDDGIDPFDTSAVENILPGKTEIKLLESELLS